MVEGRFRAMMDVRALEVAEGREERRVRIKGMFDYGRWAWWINNRLTLPSMEQMWGPRHRVDPADSQRPT